MMKDFILPFRTSAVVLKINAAEDFSLERIRQEGDVTVVFVTGGAVGRRDFDTADPIVKRIESNTDLYVSVHDNVAIDYVRKEVVESALDDLNSKIIGVVVCQQLASVDIDEEVKTVCRRRLSLSAVKHDIPLADYLAAKFLKGILFPVLVVYLVVLLANFFIRSGLEERLVEVRSKYIRESAEAKIRSAMTYAQEGLYAKYRTVPEVHISGVSDNVASMVPDGLRLTSLVFNASQARICGEAFSSETVMSLVDSLGVAVECESVNVIVLEKDRKEDLFRFEIQMML